MPVLADVKRNWAGITVITAIMGATLFGYNYVLAQAKDTAKTEVQATINKEMVDGAKKAAADAVREQLPAIAKEVAKEVAKQVVEAQKEEAARPK